MPMGSGLALCTDDKKAWFDFYKVSYTLANFFCLLGLMDESTT